MKHGKIGSLILMQIALPLIASGAFAADQELGRVLFVAGGVTITDAKGQEHIVQKGESLGQGDRLVTSAKGMVQVKMPDRGMIAVRPNSDLMLDNVIMTGNGSSALGHGVLLNAGGVRVITGGDRGKTGFLIKTPTGNIGLGEGDSEALVIPRAATVAGREVAQPVPEGTYNRVYSGAGVMTSVAGTSISLAPNQVSFIPPKQDASPVLVGSLPQSYISTPIPLARVAIAPPPVTDKMASVSGDAVLLPQPPTTLSAGIPVSSGPITGSAPPAVPLVMTSPTLVASIRPTTLNAVMPSPLPVLAPPKPVMLMPPPIVVAPPRIPILVQPTLTQTTVGGTTTTTLRLTSPTTTIITRCIVGVTC